MLTGAGVSLVYEPPDTVLTYTLYPITLDALADHESATECAVAAVPMPKRAITVVPVVALLATLMLPLACPLLAGANVAVNAALWAGESTIPEEIPLALNPGPETLRPEIVTLPVPPFVSVTVCTPSPDTGTLPKFKLVALAPRINVGALTVNTAALLVAVPSVLDTVTVNCEPLSELRAAGVA